MKFNLNSFLLATSTALDYAEEEIMHITTHHSKRCAYISLRIGIELNLSEEECFDLCSLALMHDNGVVEAFYDQNFLKAGMDNNLKILEKLVDHCKIGEHNVKNFPFLTSPKNVVLYHHEYLDGSGLYGVKAEKIPLMAQIICFADDIDMKFNLLDASVDSVGEIQAFANQHKGELYFKEIIEAFINLSTKISFWCDLNDSVIIKAVEKYLPDINADIALSDLLSISSVFSTIIDAKSNITAIHSRELMKKAEQVAKYLEWDEETSVYFQVAANLHDIGTLRVSRAVLEKTSALSKDEFEEVKEHISLTNTILGSIDGFGLVYKWASRHHERNDGSGYPFGLKDDQLCFESKLLACLDMYQALVEAKPYRIAFTHEEAVEILYDQVPKKLFEKDVVETIVKVFAEEE